MPLTDTEISDSVKSGALSIVPFDAASLQPASYDLRLGEVLSIASASSVIDLGADLAAASQHQQLFIKDTGYELQPGHSVLGHAMERISFGLHVGMVVTRSSIARLGIACNISGYANPGYEGNLPLVIANLGMTTVRLVAGRRIAQVLFFPVGSVDRLYGERGGKYQGERGPTPSRHHLDPDLQHVLRQMGVPDRLQKDTIELLKAPEEEDK